MRCKYLYYLLLLTFASCGKLLDTKPTDFLSPLNYYQTEQHLQFALNGVYDVLGDGAFYKQQFTGRMGNEADEGYFNRNTVTTGVQVYNFSATDSPVEQLWAALYKGINRANVVLDNLKNATEVSDEIKNVVKGEALFLRGYYYFILVQHWGGVPIVTKATENANNTELPRSSIAEVYAQILSDMETAEGLVLSAKAVGYGGRINKSAVRGLLARVCLFMAGYPLKDQSKYVAARDWAKKVMDDQESMHALNPDYTQVFINYAQDKYDIKESLWEVEFWGNTSGAFNETGSVGAWNGIQASDASIGVAYGYISATSKLYRSYHAADLRRDWAIAPFSYSGTTKVAKTNTNAQIWSRNAGKFRREYELVTPKTSNATPINMPILRYSDVLLMFAEAENEINQAPTQAAYDAINQVRRRGFGKLLPNAVNINEFDLKGLDYESFFNEIIDERARELCFELLRKQDLIRWGIFIQRMKAIESAVAVDGVNADYALAFKNVAQRHLLFPIPAREMAINPQLKQNENW